MNNIYKKVVALNSEVHRNLKYDASLVDYGFASKFISALIAGIEFAEASRECPIVFVRGEDKQLRAVAVMGVRNAENLCIDANGKWKIAYVPAFFRRYPFVLQENGAGNPSVVCVDESCPALNYESGQLLIDDQGKVQPAMTEMMQFLQNYQMELVRTESLVNQLDKLGLFVQQNARFDMTGGETFHLNDFYSIDEAKFNQIDDAVLPSLFHSGALGLAYLHLASLGNMRKLLNLLTPPSAQ